MSPQQTDQNFLVVLLFLLLPVAVVTPQRFIEELQTCLLLGNQVAAALAIGFHQPGGRQGRTGRGRNTAAARQGRQRPIGNGKSLASLVGHQSRLLLKEAWWRGVVIAHIAVAGVEQRRGTAAIGEAYRRGGPGTDAVVTVIAVLQPQRAEAAGQERLHIVDGFEAVATHNQGAFVVEVEGVLTRLANQSKATVADLDRGYGTMAGRPGLNDAA